MVPAYDRHFRGEHKRSVGKTHEHHHPAHAGRRDKVARTCASRVGQDVSAYVHSLIEKDISCVDEALAPFRRQVEESRMSDDELHALFEEASRGLAGKAEQSESAHRDPGCLQPYGPESRYIIRGGRAARRAGPGFSSARASLSQDRERPLRDLLVPGRDSRGRLSHIFPAVAQDECRAPEEKAPDLRGGLCRSTSEGSSRHSITCDPLPAPRPSSRAPSRRRSARTGRPGSRPGTPRRGR